MSSRLNEWWNTYAGRPGSLPDPMQGALQQGPTLYNDPDLYVEHLRRTGREHLADDLRARLTPDHGAVVTSWTAQAVPQQAGKTGRRPGRRFAETREDLF